MSEYASRRKADDIDNSYLYGPDSLFGTEPDESDAEPSVESSPGVVLDLRERAIAVEAIMAAFNLQSRAGGFEAAAERKEEIRQRYGADTDRVVGGAKFKADLSKIDAEEAMDTLMKDEELLAAGFSQQDVKDERQLMSTYARIHYGPDRKGVDATTRRKLVSRVRRTAKRVIDEPYDPSVM